MEGLHGQGYLVNVGGLVLELRAANAELLEALRAHYARFGDAGPVALQVHVRLGHGGGGPRAFAPQAEHGNGVSRFRDTGFEAVVDPLRRRVEVIVTAVDPLGEVDYAVRASVAILALDRGGVLLHAAGVVRDGGAHLFFGPSGCGKSTVARLSAGDVVLSDDLVLVLPGGRGWVAHATPFCNPPQRHAPGSARAPLRALYRLEHAPHTAAVELERPRAIAELVANAPVVNADPVRAATLLGRCAQLAASTPIALLGFTPDAAIWEVVGGRSPGAR